MQLLVYNTEGKILGKLSMHVETQSAGPQVPARKQF